MALEKLEEKAAEQAQSDLTRQDDEQDQEQKKGNKQLAYMHAAQKEAQEAKAAEIEAAREKLGKTEKHVAELEQKFGGLEGEAPEGKEDKAKAEKRVAEPAVPTLHAPEKDEEKKADPDAIAKREAEKAEAAPKAADKADPEVETVRGELLQAYEQQKAETAQLVDLINQLSALEMDLGKQKKLKSQVKDELQPQIEAIDEKKAQVKV